MIRLYHRINPNQQFSLISKTVTNAEGQYEFVRPDGIVMTNRSWFVRGPGISHSQTVHERVAAEVSLAASSSHGTTRHPLVFSGHLTPNHAGSLVLLQEQKNSGNGWTTIGHTGSVPAPTTRSRTAGASRAPMTSASCSRATRATSRRRLTRSRS